MVFSDGFKGMTNLRFAGRAFLTNEFSHDIIINELYHKAVCKTCNQEFSLSSLEEINKVHYACPVKTNEQLKKNKERDMMNMLEKYFCIWRV